MVWPWTYCNAKCLCYNVQHVEILKFETWWPNMDLPCNMNETVTEVIGEKQSPKNCWHSWKTTHQVCNLHGKTTIWTGFVEFLSGLVGFKKSSQFWNWCSLYELVSQQTQICHTLPCIDTTTRKTKLYSSWNKLVWNILVNLFEGQVCRWMFVWNVKHSVKARLMNTNRIKNDDGNATIGGRVNLFCATVWPLLV